MHDSNINYRSMISHSCISSSQTRWYNMWQQHKLWEYDLTWFHVVMSFNNLQHHKLCFIRIWRNDCIPLIQFLQTQDDQSMLCWLAPHWGHSTQVASWCWLKDPVVSHTQCGSPTLRLSMRPQSIPTDTTSFQVSIETNSNEWIPVSSSPS
jgi:hypothetical protein